jgi:Rrf2 family protein
MKLTSQEEYGLRCLVQIASEEMKFLTIPEIARREALSSAYVAKLLRLLRRAGLVRSVRGQKGGFELAMAPDDINVGVALDALGGRLYSDSFCLSHAGERAVCVRDTNCSLRSLWSAMDAAVQAVLRRTQLSHLMWGERPMQTWLREGEGMRGAFGDVTVGISRKQ